MPPSTEVILDGFSPSGLMERMFDKIEPETGASRHGIEHKPCGHVRALQLLELYAMGINFFLGGKAREGE
jgi:hypothetical protein